MGILSLGFLTACSSDDDNNNGNDGNTGLYSKGILVLNEGAMGSSTADVTYISEDLNTVNQNIYKTENGSNLGDVAQSFYESDGLIYIVVSGSNKIEIVEQNTFKKRGTITTNLSNPRYMVEENNKLYVTNWGDPSDPSDDYVLVLDKNSLAMDAKISVTEGPERIIEENDKIIVAHKGGWSNGNTISVINSIKNIVEKTIEVGDVPSGLVTENNALFVLCSGISWGDAASNGQLVKINLSDYSITSRLNFGAGEHPDLLTESNNNLYYTLGSKVYQIPLNATQLPTNALFDTALTYVYGFDVEDGLFYVTDAKDFASRGELKIFRQNGEMLKSIETGIGPNAVMVLD